MPSKSVAITWKKLTKAEPGWSLHLVVLLSGSRARDDDDGVGRDAGDGRRLLSAPLDRLLRQRCRKSSVINVLRPIHHAVICYA